MTISIKCRFTDKILFEGEYESMRHALEAAVKAGANLAGAKLAGANLADADLARANLAGANLVGANLASAHLASANLASANLAGAYLVGAYLVGAYLVGEKLIIEPIQLLGLRWPILITPQYMKVGCKLHTHEDWAGFDRLRISEMDKGAWDWWCEHKDALLGMCERHRRQAERALP